MKVVKAIHVEDTTFKQFKDLSVDEGRTVGKMLEILIQTYLKLQEESSNEYIRASKV